MYYKRLESTKNELRWESLENPMVEVHRRPFAYILDDKTGYNSAENVLKRIPSEHRAISFAAVTYPWTMLMLWGSIHKPGINYG